MLRAFLNHLEHDPAAAKLAEEGGEAFVSQSLRPFVVAALADLDAKRARADRRRRRPRGARSRAGSEGLAESPRVVRYYPTRGVAYESHLTPPPHLVGLRVGSLDALTDTAEGSEQPVVVISATALSEKVPDPTLRPHGFVIELGELMDRDETAEDLVAAGYERVDQVEERGQFAIRGDLLDIYPATEDRAVRVELGFEGDIESLRWFSTFTQRSLGEADCVEIAPAAELAPEHRGGGDRRAGRARGPAGHRRAAAGRAVPRVVSSCPRAHERDRGRRRGRRPTLRDHWDDASAPRSPTPTRATSTSTPSTSSSSWPCGRAPASRHLARSEDRDPRAGADFAARGLNDAESELEKLVRSDYTTVVAWPQIGPRSRGAGKRGAHQGLAQRRHGR